MEKKKKDTTPTKTEKIVDKPLSPVLNKKRFQRNRVQPTKKVKNAVDDAKSKSKNEAKPMVSNVNSRMCPERKASSIPVPIKDASKTNVEQHKKEVLVKCGRIDEAGLVRCFSTASGKKIEISVSNVKKYSDYFADLLPNDTVKNSSDIKERVQFINGEEQMGNLSMLYENRKFENSRTTFAGSVEEEPPANTSNKQSIKSSDTSQDLMPKNATNVSVSAAKPVHEVATYPIDNPEEKRLSSQQNFNSNDSNSTMDKELFKLERLLEERIGAKKQKELAIVSHLTANPLQIDDAICDGTKEIKGKMEANSKSLIEVNLASSDVQTDVTGKLKDFVGFTDTDINKVEEQHERFISIVNDIYEIKLDRSNKNKHKHKLREAKQCVGGEQVNTKENRRALDPLDCTLPSSKRARTSKATDKKDVPMETPSISGSDFSKKRLSPKKEKNRRKSNHTVAGKSLNKESASECLSKVKEINPETEHLKSTISLPSNNHVQICIGNNRIKINIKSENISEGKTQTQIENVNEKKEETNNEELGFKTASGKQININPALLEQAQKKFDDICGDDDDDDLLTRKLAKAKSMTKLNIDTPTASSDLFKQALDRQPITSPIGVVQFGNVSAFRFDFKTAGFALASGKEVKISEDKLKNALDMFKDINMEDSIQENNSKADNLNVARPTSKMAHELIEDVVQQYDTALEKFQKQIPLRKLQKELEAISSPDKNALVKPLISKRRLGMARCKQIPVNQERIEKAKLLLEEQPNVSSTSTPQRSFTVYNCTPVKIQPFTNLEVASHSTNTSTPKHTSADILPAGITPIRALTDSKTTFQAEAKSSILFLDKSCYNFMEMQSNRDKEYAALKRKMFIIEERKIAFDNEKNFIDGSDEERKKPRLGHLLQKKEQCKERVELAKLFIHGEENIDYFNLPKHIFEISPKNAERVHFSVLEEENKAVIRTKDGAIVIPNLSNIIGITEISSAFKAMEGVDTKLLPKDWISNHYRWIVWKLASYERKFPQYFKDCLSVENIIQQLKYRYDREIDRVERSALRRIYEKDDVPEKRLVLCVADIIQIYNNKLELELSDGWYSIKTIIDAPLCQQIYHNKIKIGTKLMIQGAELLNCEGHYPLDAPEHIRLKIGYNSTRRAAWHTKLGYYKIPQPFPIRLKTFHSDGGLIGYVKLYIARIYPIRYMEDHNGVKIWRNEKAEEKRAREFESDRMKELDKIRCKIMDDSENKEQEMPMKFDKDVTCKNISNITCPRTLFNIVQSSDNAESVIELLTPVQQKSILEYKQSLTSQKQKDISLKLSKQIEELKINKRNVMPMLRLLVMDAMENDDRAYVLNVWRPTEEHFQILKEDTYFSAFNLAIKKTGELTTNHKTHFKYNDKALTCRKVQRQLLPIAMTVDNYYKPFFNEFDTVGVIVQITIRSHDQEVWLADFIGRLLYVRILDGPTLCTLLGHFKRGQVVALSNLILRKAHPQFGQATANQSTIISQYPHQKFLQHGLELFNQQMPADMTKLLSDCDNKIEQLRNEIDSRNNSCKGSIVLDGVDYSELLDESFDEETFTSTLTKPDVSGLNT